MKLQNKKTGEIKELQEIIHNAYKYHEYNSLDDLDKEWREEYEKELERCAN